MIRIKKRTLKILGIVLAFLMLCCCCTSSIFLLLTQGLKLSDEFHAAFSTLNEICPTDITKLIDFYSKSDENLKKQLPIEHFINFIYLKHKELFNDLCKEYKNLDRTLELKGDEFLSYDLDGLDHIYALLRMKNGSLGIDFVKGKDGYRLFSFLPDYDYNSQY